MKKAGEVLARIHIALRDFIVPGITTEEIDRYVEELMKSWSTPEQRLSRLPFSLHVRR